MTSLISSLNLKSIIAAKAAISLLRGATASQQSRIRNMSLFTRRSGAAETSSCPPFLRSSVLTVLLSLLTLSGSAFAATSIPFTINTSEAVNVTGTPRIAVDVGGTTRYATYTSGTGTNALTFTYAMVAGDVDLDGVTLSSPIDLNGGTLKDLNGNDATLTFTPPNTSNVKVNYPSLGMDFVYDADGRYTLNGTVYNDLSSFLTAAGGTFSRTSIGTYFDSSGTMQTATSGTPRFDYDPVTHLAKGILIEESRTNLMTYSNDVTNGAWNTDSSFKSVGTGTAPDGVSQTNRFYDNTRAFDFYPRQTTVAASLNSGTTYTASVWVRSYGADPLILALAAYYGGSWHQGANISLSSSWQRVAWTFTPTSAVSYGVGFHGTSGAAGKGWEWADFQVEQGAFATSYIPTTSAAANRAADILTLPTSGGWFNAAAGTAFASITDYNHAVAGVFALNNGSGGNRYDVRAGQHQAIFSANGGANTYIAPLSFTQTGGGTTAISYSSAIAKATFNGGSVITGTPAISAVGINKLWIGDIDAGGYALCGHIKLFKYYPVVQSDTQLQLLTQ